MSPPPKSLPRWSKKKLLKVVNPQILFVVEAVNEILGMFALISIRGLPQEETEEGIIHIYVNEIKPAEAYLIEKYSEYITVEDRE